ncbi:hypothetical protein BBK36DRAFT_7141 [Trichoderma citrinoviride]|uniref:Tetraspanin Tsp3 n=1 Tax=Trichoderma citrinoviride TaxID=58853 RepID=A0A2T4B3J5_9HYPO|nr:hypothetical protein BBK36DRAFT_7141 [Trichoderma citrinoviride]PTB63902.1 hypothetical protein BBK36DRAFT_7141 [Trichoderma citrinoviride]
MALGLGLVFLLGSAVLFGVAAVVHFHSAHLSLPINPAITVLTVLLPILSLLNSYIYPTLLHSARHSSHPLHRLSPTILQTLQGLLTAVLATLLFEDVIPSATVECLLDNKWLRMFRAHDGESIRLIQDTLNCCGLNSVKDRAYPFPKKNQPWSMCYEMFGRDQSCRKPWRAALRSSAGADFGVVVAVGLLQILSLLMTREGTNWWNAWRSINWRRQQRVHGSESRPLLEDVTDADEVVERQDESSPRPRGYQSLPANEQDNRPRVEPSPIHHERNAWSDD